MGGFQRSIDDDELYANRTLAGEETPFLVIDLDILERNLRRMALRMRKLGVGLRPHFKTHKSHEIVEIQRELKAVGLTVATVTELASAGEVCRDITVAFPLNLSRLYRMAYRLKEQTLRLLVDSPEAIDALESLAAKEDCTIHTWLEVDCGYHRSGVDPAGSHGVDLATRIARSKRLTFDGILTHAGQAYACRSRDELLAAAEHERRVMVDYAERLRSEGLDVPGVSLGSTPTMSVVENLDGITEVRPGNYVFYDHAQVQIGSCTVKDCALTVMATVVSSQPGSGQSVIDAGAIALSKDPGPQPPAPGVPRPCFGRLYVDYAAGELDPDVWVTSVSQEHGIVNAELPVGSRVRILPNHACLVVPNYQGYTVVRGEEIVCWGGIRHEAYD